MQRKNLYRYMVVLFYTINGISKSIYILNIEPHLSPRVVSVVVKNQNNIRMIQQDLVS